MWQEKIENYFMIPYNIVPYMGGGVFFLPKSCRIVKYCPPNV